MSLCLAVLALQGTLVVLNKSDASASLIDLATDAVGKPLISGRYKKAFEYSDCFVDDARLVALNARDAADRGADIRTRTRAVEIRQTDGIWQVTVENGISGQRSTIRARVLVNAGGPWVEQVLNSGAGAGWSSSGVPLIGTKGTTKG